MRMIEKIKAELDIEEQFKSMLERCEDFADRTALVIAIEMMSAAKDIKIDRHNKLCTAEREGNLIILTEQIKLSMNAGARAIENNKRYQYGTEYIWNLHSEDSKTISYVEAAGVLRETAKME